MYYAVHSTVYTVRNLIRYILCTVYRKLSAVLLINSMYLHCTHVCELIIYCFQHSVYFILFKVTIHAIYGVRLELYLILNIIQLKIYLHQSKYK